MAAILHCWIRGPASNEKRVLRIVVHRGGFCFRFVFDQTQNIRTSSKQIKSPNLTVGGHVQNSKKHTKKETKKAYPKHNYSH